MKFIAFREAREAAKVTLEQFDGERDFPGLGKFDRVYELPRDAHGWPCAVIVRVIKLSEHVCTRIPLEIYAWRNGFRDVPHEEITADQHEAIANIQRTVTAWIRDEIEQLPKSTDKHWNRDGEI